jgi:type VI secretion system protein ImpG
VDKRFLRHYERELRHVRESAAEFGREFPKIAGRLSLDEFECADPYVERLLEGFAFMAARVQLKLEAEFPRFTQHMLQTIYPQYLSPTPSMCVVQVQPDLEDSGLAEGFPVPRGTALRSQTGSQSGKSNARRDQTPCEYRTAHEIQLWPLQISEAQYHDRDIGSLDLPRDLGGDQTPRAVIRLRIKATAGLMMNEIALDKLPLYLRGHGETPVRLYEQLLTHCTGVLVRPTTRPAGWTDRYNASCIKQVGFDDEQALLPVSPRSFQGYRLIHEYFAFPKRFLFLEVSELAKTFEHAEHTQLEILFLLKQADVELDESVGPECFALHCTPAINLFPKRADRIHISDRFHEHHVVPDRTRPLDYEVYSIDGVQGFGSQAERRLDFRPFYAANDIDAVSGHDSGAFFSVNRMARTISERERTRGRRSSYPGTEVYVSLVDADNAPYQADLRQLGIDTYCTNRDLPLRMPVGVGRTDFSIDIGAAVESVRVLDGPTPPSPSYAEGDTAWRLINHLSLNYLSVTDDGSRGATALRNLLSLYGNLAEAHIQKQIEGLTNVYVRPISRRVHAPGHIAFARGSEVNIRFDELYYEGTGCYLLGAVLDRFFAKYVTLNSFTETVVHSTARGEIKRWPTRTGQTPTL